MVKYKLLLPGIYVLLFCSYYPLNLIPAFAACSGGSGLSVIRIPPAAYPAFYSSLPGAVIVTFTGMANLFMWLPGMLPIIAPVFLSSFFVYFIIGCAIDCQSCMANQLWFKAKRYGWGWYPATWQGRAITLGYLAIVLPLAFFLQALAIFIAVPLTILLIYICYRTGEPPRWRWGH